MTIKRAREIIGKDAESMTDEQLQEAMNALDAIAEMLIDNFMKLPPEEQAKWGKVKKHNPPIAGRFA
jgi:hypothetical protein